MRARLWFALLLVAALTVALVGPAVAAEDDGKAVFPLDGVYGQPSSSDNAVMQWNEEALECVRTLSPRPPPVISRGMYIVHASTFDAWAPYSPDGKATPTQRPSDWRRRSSSERTTANKTRAISHAAYHALSDLFPTCVPALKKRLVGMGQTVGDTSTHAVVGRSAAQRVVAARAGDGANQAGGYQDISSGYQPVNTATTNTNPWRWQPLAGQGPMTPHWGNVRPFNPKTLEEIQIPAPRQESDATINDILGESARLNDQTKMIAEYWADGPQTETPPGHWNVIAQWVSRRYRHTLDQDAKLFFALNAAMMDASIAVWNTKYDYDFARPITAIRTLRAGQNVTAWRAPGLGTQTFPATEWRSYIPTPPFPEYVSGHSSYSAAGAAILKELRGNFGGNDMFGASVTFPVGSSVIEQGITPSAPVTLTWEKFEDAANQAGLSRRYGGIHWLDGDIYSRDLGKKIGEGAYSVAKKYWEG